MAWLAPRFHAEQRNNSHKKEEKEKRLYLSTMFRENLGKEGLWEKIKNINWDLLRYLLPELQYNYQSLLIIANHY